MDKERKLQSPKNLLSEDFVKDKALRGLYLTILAKNHIALNKATKIREENFNKGK